MINATNIKEVLHQSYLKYHFLAEVLLDILAALVEECKMCMDNKIVYSQDFIIQIDSQKLET